MFRFALKLVRRQQFCFRFVFYEKIIIQFMYYQIIVRTDFCIINILINQLHWLNANSSMSAFACSPGQANGAPQTWSSTKNLKSKLGYCQSDFGVKCSVDKNDRSDSKHYYAIKESPM